MHTTIHAKLGFAFALAGAVAARAASPVVCSADRYQQPPGIVANYDLFSLAADGSGFQKITDTPRLWERHPCAVPGTKRLLYAAVAGEDDAASGLHVLDVTSGTVTPLISGIRVGAIACSPDGSRIAFVHEVFGGRVLRVTGAAGGSHQALTPGGGRLEDRPVFSRDGRHIYFLSSGNDGVLSPHVVSASGGTPTKVPGTRSGCSALDLSPDGKTLGYATYDPATESSEIYLQSPTGGRERKLESGVMIVEELHFSPDGARLILVADGQITAMGLDGSGRKVISESLEATVGEAAW